MMEQFMSVKKKHPKDIVLFRMGDFFETFGEDAKITARVLNITLTSRNKKKDATPMAGFPHYALKKHLPKFINAGYYVVVVDQLENPKFAKGIVKRGPIRLVTPGTLEKEESEYTKNIFLVSLCKVKNTLGIGAIDMSTGNLQVCECDFSQENVKRALNSFDPGEVLIFENEEELHTSGYIVRLLEDDFLKDKEYEKELKEFYDVKTVNSLGMKKNSPSAVCAAMLLRYINETQKTNPDHISKPEFFNLDGSMYLDTATIRNLDLIYNSATGTTEGSLLSILDESKTNMGKRNLYNWLLNPLLDFKEVQRRLDIVNYFYESPELLEEVREILGRVNDLGRMVGNIGLNRVNAKDYKAMENSFVELEKLLEKLKGLNKKYGVFSKDFFSEKVENSLKKLANRINEVIIEEPPATITEGFVIKDGFNEKVDELRNISGSSKSWVKEFEIKEREKTGISNLKIAFNKIFGYYIEVSKANQSKVPEEYIRKQTLVNSERYITEELKEKEDMILNAELKLSELELELFQEFRKETLVYIENIKKLADEVGYLDVLQGFAFCAKQNSYVRPKVFDIGNEGRKIEVKESRHPVIEALGEEDFVSNDIFLDEGQRKMNILTGPNMSGKSTYIRQVALVIFMTQIGSFVPATSANVTMTDRIFTRVGASDDLIRGRSTFMVEMEEASNILNNATKDSLVILDEIGRGTSTYDGVSIAWALGEYLITNIGARTLFATHYHELLALSDTFSESITNLNVQVDEDEEKEEVIFLRKIVQGGTDRSYGIYVAKLAGLPDDVVKRAYEILTSFEQTTMFSKKNVKIPVGENVEKNETEDVQQKQFSLFPNESDRLLKELKRLDLEKLTPLDALNKLEKWRKKYLS